LERCGSTPTNNIRRHRQGEARTTSRTRAR